MRRALGFDLGEPPGGKHLADAIGLAFLRWHQDHQPAVGHVPQPHQFGVDQVQGRGLHGPLVEGDRQGPGVG